ncbi:nuclear transport factor 2 family protein [Hahella sp. CCB-MM4]|uniref:nuclear transport factor 2 family protein n=1 Tax=Hahella sp. (strain CCB-MM4) TaxID=1926491 RepID=UPI001FEED6F9|nr:nuclear transport factor 2 family protein [Hahella sp. CCB-MM4]
MQLFGSMQSDHIALRLDKVYAPKLYFNDTFHVITDRNQLQKYLLNLAENSDTSVTFLDATSHGDDVWLRWQMRTRFKVLWKSLDITSIGLTHLRFDQHGQITLHQDYWDSTEGFYAHLPVIGSPIRAIRSQLGPENEY